MRNFLLRHLSVFIISLFMIFPGEGLLGAQEFYWENPEKLSTDDSRFPSVVSNDKDSYIFWQEVDSSKRQIYISCAARESENQWKTLKRFIGPFSYSGSVPDSYSAAISPEGVVSVAVMSSTDTVSVFSSTDGCKTFKKAQLPKYDFSPVAPKIFCTDSGKFILFVSVVENEFFCFKISTSSDGASWSNFKNFSPSDTVKNVFSPFITKTGNSLCAVFQGQGSDGTQLYQLYATFSTDEGSSWSQPVLITAQDSFDLYESRSYAQFANQRPFVYYFDGKIYVAWERNHYQSETVRIWIEEINSHGVVPKSAQEIGSKGIAHRPGIFSYDGKIFVNWFDTGRGSETVKIACNNGALWDIQNLSQSKNPTLFVFPLINQQTGKLSFVWQENTGSTKAVPSINYLKPDTTVRAVKIIPQNFKDGGHYKNKNVKVKVSMPVDSSGIAGYSWCWSQDENEVPEQEIMKLPNELTVNVKADEDGPWYFKAIAQDYAGNWSKPSVTSYVLDFTPPLAPRFDEFPVDLYGFASKNSFTVRWLPAETDDDIAGYNWNIKYLGAISKNACTYKNHPLRMKDEALTEYVQNLLEKNKDSIEKGASLGTKIKTTRNFTGFENYSNGLYVISVCAIDTVGNVGPKVSMPLLVNKFQPFTSISSVKTSKSLFGDLSLEINGAGFLYDGKITRIYITKKNQKPYDLTLELSNGAYSINSDSKIKNVSLEDLGEGEYFIGLWHSDRGLYMSKKPVLSVSNDGTVKVDKDFEYNPGFVPVPEYLRQICNPGSLLGIIVLILICIGILVFSWEMVRTIHQSVILHSEVKAFIKGEHMKKNKSSNQLEKRRSFRERAASLKWKLAGFTSALVVMIILLVAIPLGYNMIESQEETLASGLSDRIEVLLESIASGVKTFMPSENVLELTALPSQSSALPESDYVTILGKKAGSSSGNLDTIWATNDSSIEDKIDSKNLVYGQSKFMTSEDSELKNKIDLINSACEELNLKAGEELGKITADIYKLNKEGASLALKTDAKSVQRREEISQITTEMNGMLNKKLSEYSEKGVSSLPAFNSRKIDRENLEYLFYRPVLYRSGTSDKYVGGIVLLKVRTDILVDSIEVETKNIFRTVIIIALFAIALGAAGAFLVSTVIISPVRKMVKHVKLIGETKKKKNLQPIKIKTKDEIGLLGQTINRMLEELKHAEQQAGLDMDARAVQSAFLPLLPNKDGTKQTVSSFEDKNISCFGYYEGTDGVSGDFFDYKKLDDRWYVFIKSDASGHGVPASLIVTIVAMYFRTYFENWSYAKQKTNINDLVSQINEFINTLNLKGKFVTLIVVLYDSKTGESYLCNAGDNIVHIYDQSEKKILIQKLKETPAAGPFPLFMVDMKGGFIVEKGKLKQKDILYLYTDGIEEATRIVRDSEFRPIMIEKLDGAGNVLKNKDGKIEYESRKELLEADRVQQILEAVFDKSEFILQKEENPVEDEILKFDFSSCEGTLEESIIALASVEKVFRMYKPSTAIASDTISVDRRIDLFLQKHFNLYEKYCVKAAPEVEQEETNYIYYSYIFEDEQADDLTLFAMQRN